MKNLYISFGYFGKSKFDRFSYWLCNKIPLIPTIELSLFKTYGNSEKPFIIRHSIYLGFLKYYYRIEKFKGKWRINNLTDK